MKKIENEQKRKERKYYIPIDGKLYETDKKIYKTYYKMDRRERYLVERSEKYELSYDALNEADYPVEERMTNKPNSVENAVVTSILIEKMLKEISKLTEEEKWLISELFFCGKSEVVLAKEIGIARTTLQSRKYKILAKIKKLLKD